MPDYQLGKIYKIVCNITRKVYYGSTCEPTLARRLAKHMSGYNSFKNGIGRYVTSYSILENDDYYIVLVEKCSCNDKMELHQRERFYIENNSSKYGKNGTMKFSNLKILKFHGTIFSIITTLRLKLKI
jgi:hypothetical protein